MAYVRTCARILRMGPSQCTHLPFCSLEKVERYQASWHKHSIHDHRKQHPSFLEIQVIVQCDAQSVSEMLCITLYLKKKPLLTDLPILLGFKMQIFSSYGNLCIFM